MSLFSLPFLCPSPGSAHSRTRWVPGSETREKPGFLILCIQQQHCPGSLIITTDCSQELFFQVQIHFWVGLHLKTFPNLLS